MRLGELRALRAEKIDLALKRILRSPGLTSQTPRSTIHWAKEWHRGKAPARRLSSRVPASSPGSWANCYLRMWLDRDQPATHADASSPAETADLSGRHRHRNDIHGRRPTVLRPPRAALPAHDRGIALQRSCGKRRGQCTLAVYRAQSSVPHAQTERFQRTSIERPCSTHATYDDISASCFFSIVQVNVRFGKFLESCKAAATLDSHVQRQQSWCRQRV